MSSIHLAALLSLLLIKYLNFPAALESISLLVTSGVPFGLRNTGNGRLFRQQGHTTGRQDKWAGNRDSFIIGNHADICVVAYNKEVGPRKVKRNVACVSTARRGVENLDLDRERERSISTEKHSIIPSSQPLKENTGHSSLREDEISGRFCCGILTSAESLTALF